MVNIVVFLIIRLLLLLFKVGEEERGNIMKKIPLLFYRMYEKLKIGSH